MNRIICLGNRLVPSDAAGLAVHERLCGCKLPAEVQLIEGGLAGLDLLPLLEQGGRVVFVDAVFGFTIPGQLVVLDQATLLQHTSVPAYGHAAGLPYLLTVLPRVCEGILPEKITLIGLEGRCSDQVLDAAAALSISLAATGNQFQGRDGSHG